MLLLELLGLQGVLLLELLGLQGVLLAFSLRAASGASALYLCFTLRPAIFNSLRPVTVGSGRIG